jgi:hypothetical protein
MRIKMKHIMSKFLVFLFFSIAFDLAAKPMEPIKNYNVVLVHGAADGVKNGFKCDGNAAKEIPYTMYEASRNDPDNNPWKIGGAPGMVGSYDDDKKLTYWLDTRVFENSGNIKDRMNSTHIYLQRSFTKPAGSPRDNGHEIGDIGWQCGERRSLIEEAQEVKAKGRVNLSNLRKSVENRDKLPPSRNILIAHSMGGVA